MIRIEKATMRFEYTPEEIREELDALVGVGLVTLGADGRYRFTKYVKQVDAEFNRATAKLRAATKALEKEYTEEAFHRQMRARKEREALALKLMNMQAVVGLAEEAS